MFALSDKVVGPVSDSRQLPRIPTHVCLGAALIMFWARIGSLNGLEQSAGSAFWRKWLGRALPSAETIGNVHALMDCAALRDGMHEVYTRLKRNKALPGIGGLDVAVLDGHETSSSYLRHCEGCLERKRHAANGDRIQYYHRNVTIMILGERFRFLLDAEPQRKGEDEVATALRLLDRVLVSYPRAFQVITVDALYAQAKFVNYLVAHHKHVLIVLKDERRDLYQDSSLLFRSQKPKVGKHKSSTCLWWDDEGFTSWDGVKASLRVVRSQEKTRVKRQATKEFELKHSEWIWVTTLPQSTVPTELVVRLGHARWDIENHGFNHLVNAIRADHVYKHDPIAIEAFCLVSFLAVNLLLAFLTFNVKGQSNQSRSFSFWAQTFSSDIYKAIVSLTSSRAP